jgi:hemolysin activation/secretion protein
MRRTHANRALLACGMVLGALPGVALAQVIERHPAPVPPTPPAHVAPPVEADRNADATSLGVTLRHLRIDTGAQVLQVEDQGAAAQSPVPGLASHLRRFIGQDLSRRLIAEIRAEIARTYRTAGHPFVHVSTPEQDLAGGTLTVKVQEFTLGQARVTGADQQHILAEIHQKPGQTIDADALADDLDWLNRYPFRRVEAVFAPGATPGTTDVTYAATPSRGWSLGGGYANSGSPDTGMNRFDIYALAALPVVPDAWASYQLTTSGPGLVGLDNPPSGSRRYVSHAGRIVLPTGVHQALELTFDDVQTTQPIAVFDDRQHTREWAFDYRFGLSNLSAALPGEITLGADWKTQAAVLSFGGTPIRDTDFHVGQIDVGYSWKRFDSHGSTAIDMTVHVSPSGIDGLDTAAAYNLASQGTSQTARYAYVNGVFTRQTRFSGLSLNQSLIWQWTGVRLPQTELFGLGSANQVRAYTLDDGAFDRGIVLRNELRLDPLALGSGPFAGSAQPYLYGDAGYAGRVGLGASHVVGAVGGGIEIHATGHLTVAADGGVALADQGNTRAGGGRANVRANLAF